MDTIHPAFKQALESICPSRAANAPRTASVIAAAIHDAAISKYEVMAILNAIYHRMPSEPEFEESNLDLEEVIASYERAFASYEHRLHINDGAPVEESHPIVDGDLEVQRDILDRTA